MRKISLDTNAYSALVNGNSNIKAIIEYADEVIIPFIVLGELFYGFKHGDREQYNKNQLERFLDLEGVDIAHSTVFTVEIYGKICNNLRQKGQPIPSNDIWIAALTIENDCQIISFDKHFLQIEGLNIWKKND